MTEQTEEIKGWLTEAYDYERPNRGELREGVILKVEEHAVIVDVGLKRDGIVPEKDIERLGEDAMEDLEPGQEVETRVWRPEDREGNLVLSMYQARLEKDWNKARGMMDSGEVWRGKIIDYNKGGLLAEFGRLRGFVPGSHLWTRGKSRSSSKKRKARFKEYVGEELPLKVIEVNRNRRRLIMSERLARRQLREENKERLLSELMEGQVVEGTVRHLCDFGAFVDLGGADGLIHVSELSWQHVQHPKEVLQVGDEIKVYILRLDHKRKRIGLSLKRLQPQPWELVDTVYFEGQLVQGKVTGIADFGAFVALDVGVEGLVHISELSDPPPERPRDVVQKGDELVVRILHIDSNRQRIGLSLKEVSDYEREAWLAEQSEEAEESTESEESPASAEEPEAQETPAAELETAQESEEQVPAAELEAPTEQETSTAELETAEESEEQAPAAELEASTESAGSDAPSEENAKVVSGGELASDNGKAADEALEVAQVQDSEEDVVEAPVL